MSAVWRSSEDAAFEGRGGSYFNAVFWLCNQGTTLAGPYRNEKRLGFSPCRSYPVKRKAQGLKPRYLLCLDGPTKVVP
jgi:hypothetical protein